MQARAGGPAFSLELWVVPTKNSVHVEAFELAEAQKVGCRSHVHCPLCSAAYEVHFGLAPSCTLKSWRYGINFWSCSVPTAVVASGSQLRTGFCGFGSPVCGPTGDPRC